MPRAKIKKKNDVRDGNIFYMILFEVCFIFLVLFCFILLLRWDGKGLSLRLSVGSHWDSLRI